MVSSRAGGVCTAEATANQPKPAAHVHGQARPPHATHRLPRHNLAPTDPLPQSHCSRLDMFTARAVRDVLVVARPEPAASRKRQLLQRKLPLLFRLSRTRGPARHQGPAGAGRSRPHLAGPESGSPAFRPGLQEMRVENTAVKPASSWSRIRFLRVLSTAAAREPGVGRAPMGIAAGSGSSAEMSSLPLHAQPCTHAPQPMHTC